MIRRFLVVLMMLSLGACAAARPYKLPLHEDVRAQLGSVAVYAAVDDKGIGVERLVPDGPGLPFLVVGQGLATGIISSAVGTLVFSVIESVQNARPLRIAQSGADQLVPLFDQPLLTTYLRDGLNTNLPTTTMFTAGVDLKALPAGQQLRADAFPEQAVLAVTLYYALTHDLRCVHVQAQAVALSKSARTLLGKRKDVTSDDKSAGVVYRNLFDFYSDPLPRPAGDPRAEDYPERVAEQLLQQWLANGGVKLSDNLKLGTATVLELLARDLMDPSNVEHIRDRWKKPVATTGDRVIMQYVAYPVAGGLSSEQTGFWLQAPNGVSYAAKPGSAPPSASK